MFWMDQVRESMLVMFMIIIQQSGQCHSVARCIRLESGYGPQRFENETKNKSNNVQYGMIIPNVAQGEVE